MAGMDYQDLYERLERSRISKYDLLLKTLFLPRKSQLRRLLSIPDGEAYAIELDDWNSKVADAVILGAAPCHVEFQTEADDTMPWRMLDYFVRIQESSPVTSTSPSL